MQWFRWVLLFMMMESWFMRSMNVTCFVKSAIPSLTEIFEPNLFAEVRRAPKSASAMECPSTFDLRTVDLSSLDVWSRILFMIIDLMASIIIWHRSGSILVGQDRLFRHGPIFEVYFLDSYILRVQFILLLILIKTSLEILLSNFFGHTFVAIITSGRLFADIDLLSVFEKAVVRTHFRHKHLLWRLRGLDATTIFTHSLTNKLPADGLRLTTFAQIRLVSTQGEIF